MADETETAALITYEAVAAIMGVTKMHVRKLIRDGVMAPPIKLGRAVRFNREAVLAWVNAGCKPVTKQKSSRKAK